MIYLMKVSDSFCFVGGFVVTGGDVDHPNLTAAELKSLIGSSVVVDGGTGEGVKVVGVRDVAISESLLQKRNLALLLDLEGEALVTRGAAIYLHSENQSKGQ